MLCRIRLTLFPLAIFAACAVGCGSSGSNPGGSSGSGSGGGSGGSSGSSSSGSGGGSGSSSGASSSGSGGSSGGGSGGSSGSSSGGSSGGGSGSSSSGGDGGINPVGPLTTVNVYQTSRNSGAAMAPEHMADKGPLTISAAPMAGRTTISLDLTQQKQTILGFGAALTEAVASAVGTLPAASQTALLDTFYGANGSGYTLARTHLGSCDFALSAYSFDDTTGTPDPTLAGFSIAHDQTVLIPFLKTALTASGNKLRILSSPWSAPAWMKDNKLLKGNGSDGSLLAMYYPVYAQYLVKYLQAYAAAGVPLWGITTQNEPLGVGGTREGMQWGPTQMNQFIRDNLGPLLQADATLKNLQVFFFDHNKGPAMPVSDEITWANSILKDAKTNPMVAGTAVHWYGSTFLTYEDGLDALHAVDPNKLILFDEGTDDGLADKSGAVPALPPYSWMSDDWYWQKDAYDWGWTYASKVQHPAYQPVYRYIRDIIVGLNHWYNGWIDWNMVLNKDGGPGHILNPCAASILVDTAATPPYYQTPIFYAMQHFSKFIHPQAKAVVPMVNLAAGVMPTDYDGFATQDGKALIATGATNTDGSVAVVLFNETKNPIDYSVVIGAQSVSSTIPAQSLQTLLWH